jgi:dephospho-CoA kinase
MPVAAGKPVIGLTGGIGSGKSLVASQLAALGCAVIDADEIAAQALEDPHVVREVLEKWGEAVRGPDGRIDRQALARIVFDDPDELARLEELIHPMVHRSRAALHRRYQRDPLVRAIVEDCPLLMEKGLDADCDAVLDWRRASTPGENPTAT